MGYELLALLIVLLYVALPIFVIVLIVKFFIMAKEVSENKRKLAYIEGILVKQFGKIEIKNQESDSNIYDPLRSDKKE